MHTGMLWFDNSNTALQIKIKNAADYYQKKYGKRPNLSLANPGMFENTKPFVFEGVEVRPYRTVLPGHIWIGIKDEA